MLLVVLRDLGVVAHHSDLYKQFFQGIRELGALLAMAQTKIEVWHQRKQPIQQVPKFTFSCLLRHCRLHWQHAGEEWNSLTCIFIYFRILFEVLLVCSFCQESPQWTPETRSDKNRKQLKMQTEINKSRVGFELRKKELLLQ